MVMFTPPLRRRSIIASSLTDRILNGGGTVIVNSDGSITITPATNQVVTIAGGTQTSSAPLTITQTWNSALVTFTGVKFNATDTTSAAASRLLDLQVGTVSKFSVDKYGRLALGIASTVNTAHIQDFSGGQTRLILQSGAVGTDPGFQIWNAAGGVKFLFEAAESGVYIQSGTGYDMVLRTNAGTEVLRLLSAGTATIGGPATFSPPVVAGGSNVVTITQASHTAVTTEKSAVILSAHTVAITGAIATFRDIVINAATFNGAFTITSAITVDIAAPIAGTSTLTSKAALRLGGSLVTATAALATTDVTGFLYVPTCAGPPTGVPEAWTGTAPLIYDTTNDILYVYRAGWKQPKVAGVAAAFV